jgi:hypothetical protein
MAAIPGRSILPYPDAIAELRDMVAASVAPTLTDAQLNRLLRRAQVPDEDGNVADAYATWTASTAYGVGYRVVPNPRNGYVFTVTTAGTSGASQPTWPDEIGETVVDGTVTWTTEATAPWVPSYSRMWLNAAAAAGWKLKEAAISNYADWSADSRSFSVRQLVENCQKQAEYYRKLIVGSPQLQGRTAQDDLTFVDEIVI